MKLLRCDVLMSREPRQQFVELPPPHLPKSFCNMSMGSHVESLNVLYHKAKCIAENVGEASQAKQPASRETPPPVAGEAL